MKPTYLDFNASAPLEESVKSALLSFFSEGAGNASSIHSFGRKSKAIVDKSREQLAGLLGVSEPDQLVFTSSATESINTALKGFARQREILGRKARFVTSGLEHEATLGTLRELAAQGHGLEVVAPERDGSLDPEKVTNALGAGGSDTLLSLMAAQNETGVLLPWDTCFKAAKELGCTTHLDGVQALGKLSDFTLGSHVDMASLSAHKIGGPTGVGLLYLRRSTPLSPLLHGGAQERKRRAGTMNVAGILGFGVAASLGSAPWKGVLSLRNSFEEALLREIPGVAITGQALPRLPNTSHLLFDDVRGEALVMGLDLNGFAVSSGSACNSGSLLPSPALLAMGWDREAALSALRVSLGPATTAEEMAAFLLSLKNVVQRIRDRKAQGGGLKSLTKSAASS